MRIEVALSPLSRIKGLLGLSEYPHVLLLYPCNDIHTFGMRFAIDVAFMSGDGVVLEVHREVGACRRLRCKAARATLERMSGEVRWFEPGDRVDLKEVVNEACAARKRRL